MAVTQIPNKYLDNVGLEYLWSIINNKFAAKDYIGNFTPVADEKTLVEYINAKTSGIATEGNVKANTVAINVLNGGDAENAGNDAGKSARKIAQEEVDALTQGAVKNNTDAIAILNGAGEGSVDKKITDAFNEFAGNLSDDNIVNTYKELIDYAAEHGAEFTELVGEVTENTTAIETLNGDTSTVGSVDKKIADAIATLDTTTALSTSEIDAAIAAANATTTE